MARQAVAVALPLSERGPVTSQLTEAGFEVDLGRHARPDGGSPRRAPRYRGRDPRRGERLRHLARVLRPAPRGRAGDPGPHGRLAPGARPADRRRSPRPRSTTSTSPGPTRPSRSAGGSRRCSSGPTPSTTAAARSCRPSPVHRDGWGRRAQIVVVFNPKGGVGKTTIATNLAVALQVAPRPEGPARRRRHGDRPRARRRSASSTSGRSSTAGATRPTAASPRGSSTSPPSTPAGCGSCRCPSSPLHTEILEPDRVADAIAGCRRRLRLHRRRHAPELLAPQPGDLRSRRPDPRPGDARTCPPCGPPSSSATSRSSSASARSSA